MSARRFQDFFGDDLQETLDSIKSVPGAFGNIIIAASRQIRVFDALAFAFVVGGWAWVVVGYGIAGNGSTRWLLIALLPTAAWFAAGIAGGLVFHIAGIGVRSLLYWESYLLMLLFAVFGVISLRLALNPRDSRIYRATPAEPEA